MGAQPLHGDAHALRVIESKRRQIVHGVPLRVRGIVARADIVFAAIDERDVHDGRAPAAWIAARIANGEKLFQIDIFQAGFF